MSKRILIVGANSSVAVAFAQVAAEQGHQFYGLYHRETNRVEADLFVDLISQDADWAQLEVDAVVFFAAHIPSGQYNVIDKRFNDVNQLLLDCTANFPAARFVYCSSVAVYGLPLDLPLHERSPFNQPSNYALAKLAGENIVHNHANGISLRIGAMYGNQMQLGLVHRYCHQAKLNGEIVVYGDGSRLQDYLHVSDVAQCLLAAIESDVRQPVLCVSGKSTSNLELAQLIAANLADCKVSLQNVDESPSTVFENTKSCELLSWQPSISIEQGISELIAGNL